MNPQEAKMFFLDRGPDNHFYLVCKSRNEYGRELAEKLKINYYSFESIGDSLKLDELFRTPFGIVANKIFVVARAKSLIDQVCGEDELWEQLNQAEDKYVARLNKEIELYNKK